MGLAKQLKDILEKFGLTSKMLCYMKDVGTNFASMIVTLKSKISCEVLSLPQHFDGSCFGHVMNKVVQDATNDSKIFKKLVPINVKST